jgi:hypothetical protein
MNLTFRNKYAPVSAVENILLKPGAYVLFKFPDA